MTSKRNINNPIDDLEEDTPNEELEVVLNEQHVGTEWNDENEEGDVIKEETTVIRIGGEPDV